MIPDTNDRIKSTDSSETNSDNESDHIVTFNIGGRIFQTKASTLKRTCAGRLARLSETDPAYNAKSEEFFFDRDPYYFRLVLQFYRTGELHVDGAHCAKTLRNELTFWGLEDRDVGDCCWRNVSEARDREFEFQQLKKLALESMENNEIPKRPTRRQKLWAFLDNPKSSLPAKIWCLISFVLILVSIACYAINTLPSIKATIREKLKSSAEETPENCSNNNNNNNATAVQNAESTLFTLNVIDACCLTFFSIDFVLRLISTPRRLQLIKSALFIGDVLFLIPGWIMVGLMFTDLAVWLPPLQDSKTLDILKVVTLARISRVIRLGWYSHGFRTLVLVLKKSTAELLSLGNILAINVAVFGFLVYSVEVGTNPEFDSAFRGFWWSAITMSTVGYGDIFPITPIGCVIGGACAVSGVIIIGLLIPIIARNFRVYYRFRNIHFPLKFSAAQTAKSVKNSKESKKSSCSTNVPRTKLDDHNKFT